MDLRERRTLDLAPNDGPFPWWIFAAEPPRSRHPSSREYMRLAGLLFAGAARRIDEVMPCKGALWERLMRPFLLAALNTEPEKAPPLWPAAVLRETLAKGGGAYRPPDRRIRRWPPRSSIRRWPSWRQRMRKCISAQRLRRIVLDASHVVALEFGGNTVPLSPDDTLVLATPPWVSRDWCRGFPRPTSSAPSSMRISRSLRRPARNRCWA